MSVVPSSLRDWVRESLLLEGAERRVRALGPERQALLRKHYDAAMRRVILADDLSDDNGLVAALVLYRDAVAPLAAAVVAACDPEATPNGSPFEAPWDALATLTQAGRLPAPPPVLQEARRVLTPASGPTFDEASPDELRRKQAVVREALRWLGDRVEPRTLREIRRSRGVRLAIVGAIVLVLLALGMGRLVGPTNLALHKVVTLSHRHPASVAPVDNSGLVNGQIEPNYGIHTASGGAWVMIDLAAARRIGEVVVHNRADGWFDEGLPFILEISEDGARFTEVAQRGAHFTASQPWIAIVNGGLARYVRIRSDKYIALTEVEVHEAK